MQPNNETTVQRNERREERVRREERTECCKIGPAHPGGNRQVSRHATLGLRRRPAGPPRPPGPASRSSPAPPRSWQALQPWGRQGDVATRGQPLCTSTSHSTGAPRQHRPAPAVSSAAPSAPANSACLASCTASTRCSIDSLTSRRVTTTGLRHTHTQAGQGRWSRTKHRGRPQ